MKSLDNKFISNNVIDAILKAAVKISPMIVARKAVKTA